MSYWNTVAAVLSLILGGYLLWAAYRRPNTKQKHLRALVSVVAVTCLYLLYLDISSGKKTLSGNNDVIIILTSGSSTDTLEKLLSTEPDSKVYTTEPELAAANRKVILIDHLNEIPGISPLGLDDSARTSNAVNSINPMPGKIHVLGYGLDDNELTAFDNTNFIFHPPLITRYFNSINWNRQLNTGEKLIIQGSFANNEHGPIDIILKGFNTILDSTRIPGDSLTSFQLNTIPKQKGRAVYTLLLLEGKDTIQQEKIPFETVATDPLKILMLSSSPDFENKFLKNWLFANNYPVAIRTTVSTNKFNTEYLNISGIRVDRINNNLLNNFDLVIGDATALNKLPGIELNSIRTAVQQEGLGLIIKIDSITPASLFFNAPFRYMQSASLNNQLLHLETADTSTAMPSLTSTRPIFISNTEQVRPVIRDKEGHLFSAAAVSGNGKLLSTTIANTYNWVLSGDTTAYRQYWSDLINETSKKKPVDQMYSIDPLITGIDMPVTIKAETGDSLPFQARVNRSLIPMNQRFVLPFQWTGTYWPRKTGWQSIATNENHFFYWYSFAKNDWKNLQAVKRIEANKLKSSLYGDNHQSAEKAIVSGFQRYTRLYIIVMFIICCTYLWIEEKFHNSR